MAYDFDLLIMFILLEGRTVLHHFRRDKQTKNIIVIILPKHSNALGV